MVTQWAKTAFLTGLGGVRGGTLTVKCPDGTYRFGEDGESGCDPDGPRRAVLPARAHGERHRPRRVVHGRRLDDARSGAAGAADAAQPAGARRAESTDRGAAPGGGRRRAPPPGQFPRRESPTHPSALRPRQRVLPPLSRCRSAHVLLRLLRVGRRCTGAGASAEGRSHLPGAETRAHRPRARDWQRVGRLRRLGGDPLRLPRDDHDDQRRTVSPRVRMAVADRRGRGAHRGVARGLSRTDRAVRQGRQHRDVRGGRSQATTTTTSRPSTACSHRMA